MKTMALSREITLTIDNYNITLDKEIKIYEYDAINLCFTIQECGIVMRDGKAHNRVMPVVALKAYMLIETPQGTDSVEATNIVRNKIMFSLGNKYSRFVGTGKMQIILKDFDGCRITLPEFAYEVKQSINTGWDDGSFDVLITEKEDIVITDELGRPVETTKISEFDETDEITPQTYTMVINEDGNKKIKLDTMMESISEMIEFDVEEIDRRIDEMIEVYDDEEVEVEFPSLHNDVERIKGEVNEISSSFDNKANKNDLDIEKNRIDNIIKLENGSTTGDAELIDGRIGVNGKIYNVLGDSTRESLDAIYNGLGGVNLKDITNLSEYTSNSNMGEIVNNNVIIFNTSTPYVVLTTTSKANRNYLVYCSEKIRYTRTLLGSWKDEGITCGNYGFVTPTNDSFKVVVGVDSSFVDKPKNVTFYCVDVTGTNINSNNFMNIDLLNNINKWFFTTMIKNNIVKPCSSVINYKVWASETWEKVDDETIITPYDVLSTVTINKNLIIGKRYMILFSGVISKVRTVLGSWKDNGTISNNIATIDITQNADYLVLETYSGGTNKVYCIDVTNNLQLEEFIIRYGVDSLYLNYKDKEFTKILGFIEDGSNTTNPNTSTWRGKKWIAYGDSITVQNSYTLKVANELGLNMINKGIGGTTVSDIDGNATTAFCRDERINTFDTDADLVTIMGGTNDWNKTKIGDLTYNNGFDTTKFKGALATTIVKIQARCPNATIVVCSLIGGRYNSGGVNANIPTADQFGQTSLDFAKATKEVAEFMNVEYCDTWGCGINNWNRIDMIEDSVHPTKTKGTDKIAIKLIGCLKGIEPLI